MSRVSTLKQWKNSDTVNAKDYVLERDRLATAVNDNYDRILGLTNILTTSLTSIGDVSPFDSLSADNYIISTTDSTFIVNLPDEVNGTMVQFYIKDMVDYVNFVGEGYTFQADDTFEGVTITMIYSGGEWFYTTYSSNKHTHEQYDYHKSGWEPYTALTSPVLSWDRATRTFSYTNPNSIRYWSSNEVFTKSSDSITIPNVTAGYFIYYTGDNLVYSTQVWDRGAGHCPVMYVAWNAEDSVEVVAGYELHKIVMDADTHGHFHETFGTLYAGGLIGSAVNNTEIRYSDGIIRDEDIRLEIGSLVGQTQVHEPLKAPILYRLPNGDFTKVDTIDNEIVLRIAGSIQVNTFNDQTGLWQLEEVSNNKYFAMWVVATNDIYEPIALIPGQVESDSLTLAENTNNIFSMQFGALPMEEFVILDRILIKRVGTSYEVEEFTSYKTGKVNAVTVNVGAHEHDDRYYTEDEINNRSHLGDSAPLNPTLGGLWFDTTIL